MKALKIFAFAIISSMFLWACETETVLPETGKNTNDLFEKSAEQDASDFQDLYGPH